MNAQLTGIVSKGQAANLALETKASGKDVTSTFLGRQQQEVSRQTAIKALPLQAQILGAEAEVTGSQNTLKLAQDKLDTVFDIQNAYQTNLYNYNKSLRDAVFNFATNVQKQKIIAQQKADDNTFNLQRDKRADAQAIATIAMKNGQSDIAAKITQLDPASATFDGDLAKLQAQIVEKADPVKALELELKKLQIEKAKLDITKTEEEIKEEEEAASDKLTDEARLQFQSKVDTIDEILSSRLPAVGLNIFTRGDPLSMFTGANRKLIAQVDQITSRETLDTLINLKKAGGTLGALSDQERIMLESAATKIGTWRLRDGDGNTVGYNVSHADFKDELNKIKDIANRAIEDSDAATDTKVSSYLDDVEAT